MEWWGKTKSDQRDIKNRFLVSAYSTCLITRFSKYHSKLSFLVKTGSLPNSLDYSCMFWSKETTFITKLMFVWHSRASFLVRQERKRERETPTEQIPLELKNSTNQISLYIINILDLIQKSTIFFFANLDQKGLWHICW